MVEYGERERIYSRTLFLSLGMGYGLGDLGQTVRILSWCSWNEVVIY
jgi:hypothetical protein